MEKKGREIDLTNKVGTILITENEFEIYNPTTGEFITNQPTKHYIQLASGDYLFFKTRCRMTAQQSADEMFGKGFYTIRVSSHGSGDGNYTCRGTETRPSPSSKPPR